MSQQALEQRCHVDGTAHGGVVRAQFPEFFDKSLFRNFIELLRRRNVLQISAEGNLVYGDLLPGVAADAQWVLSEQIRHSILQVTLGQ